MLQLLFIGQAWASCLVFTERSIDMFDAQIIEIGVSDTETTSFSGVFPMKHHPVWMIWGSPMFRKLPQNSDHAMVNRQWQKPLSWRPNTVSGKKGLSD